MSIEESNSNPSNGSVSEDELANNPSSESNSRRRSSARRRHTTTLAGSFKKFIDDTPAEEMDEISTQLQEALGVIPPSITESFTLKDSSVIAVEDSAEAMPNFKALRRHTGEAYYTPRSTQRRVSRAGSEIADNMKLCATMALAELGEISDDDDELFVEQLGVTGEMQVSVKELDD